MSNLPLPNFTQVPNFIIDDKMRELSHAEFKIITLILRYTTGYHRRKAYISYNHFEEKCGVSKKWVQECCNKLESFGWIKITRGSVTNSNLYEILVEQDSKTNEVGYSVPQGVVLTTTEVGYSVPQINKEKENNKENNNSKEKKSSVVAAVFPCLKEIEMPRKEKVFLSKRYDEERVIKALQWINHPSTKINETFIQALKWACREEPEIPTGNGPEANKKKALEKLGEFEGVTSEWEISILTRYVEFGDKRNGGNTSYTYFSYDKKSFWYDIMKFIEENIPSLYKKVEPA